MMNKNKPPINKCAITLGIFNSAYKVKCKHLHWICYLYQIFMTSKLQLAVSIQRLYLKTKHISLNVSPEAQ